MSDGEDPRPFDDPESEECEEEGSNPCRESQKPRPYLYIGIAFLVCAVILVLVLNTPMTQASAQASLYQGSWQLQAMTNGNGGLDTAAAAPVVTARFTRDGRLGGYAGCNEYSATFSTESYAIAITAPVTSLRSCPGPGVMSNETLYLASLANATEYRVSPRVLKLYDRTGVPLLAFVPGPA